MRFKSLDSLRGLAALAVVFHHCLWTFRGYVRAPINPLTRSFWATPFSIFHWSPLHIICNGATAVMLFFVLSGFVLTLSLEGGSKYVPYAIKRVVRIYLPFAAAIFFAALLYLFVNPKIDPRLSDWFNYSCWGAPVSWRLVLGHLAMTGSHEFMSLDNVIWSLVHEIRISLILPFLVLALQRWPFRTLVATVLAALPAQVLALHTPDIVSSWFLTIVYIHLFAIGGLVALKRVQIRTWVLALPKVTHAGLWIFALFLMWLPIANWITPFFAGIGAAALVALCFSDANAVAHLTGPVPLWLGKVSYSLYLVHLPILLTVFHLLYGRAPSLALVILTVGLSLVAAELMNRLVERPSMDLAKLISAKI